MWEKTHATSHEERWHPEDSSRPSPTALARKDATDPLTVHRAWIQGEYAKNGGFLVRGYGPISPSHKHQETHRETLVKFVDLGDFRESLYWLITLPSHAL
jgi:hypothetical protein